MKDEEILASGSVEVVEIIKILWAKKLHIVISVSVFSIFSVFYAISIPNYYKSSALLAPNENESGGLSGMLRGYSELASLAGVSVPGQSNISTADLALQVVKSRSFAEDFAKKYKITHDLLAVEYWDRETNSLKYNSDVYDAENERWISKNGISAMPDMTEVHDAYNSALTIEADKATGLVRMTVEHKSPVIATRWLNWIITDLNEAIKDRDIREAENSIRYLRAQIETTSLKDIEAVFYSLIEGQTQKLMLAAARPDYVFSVIDRPFIPERKAGPSRAVICVFGALLGLIFSVSFVLINGLYRRD